MGYSQIMPLLVVHLLGTLTQNDCFHGNQTEQNGMMSVVLLDSKRNSTQMRGN